MNTYIQEQELNMLLMEGHLFQLVNLEMQPNTPTLFSLRPEIGCAKAMSLTQEGRKLEAFLCAHNITDGLSINFIEKNYPLPYINHTALLNGVDAPPTTLWTH